MLVLQAVQISTLVLTPVSRAEACILKLRKLQGNTQNWPAASLHLSLTIRRVGNFWFFFLEANEEESL